MLTSDAARWAAVRARDAGAADRFVFAVTTTGVYCRPNCGAKRAKRTNVRFFADAEAAREAGFRPCRRCHPDREPSADPVVANACRLIEAAESPPALRDLAAQLDIGPHRLHRAFKATLGLTPKAYAAAVRADRARSALKPGTSVTTALYDAGFNAPGRFYAASDGVLGMAPKAYKTGGAGETVRYATAPCAYGVVLVAATGAGICALSLGDAAEPLVEGLHARFPNAERVGDDADFAELVAEAVHLCADPAPAHGLPLDVRGTAFQARVWAALRAIPTGETRSYAEIAAAIGAPNATRAVARACATNEVALLIPCHRVVRSDGGSGGYRWGEERKRAILARERG